MPSVSANRSARSGASARVRVLASMPVIAEPRLRQLLGGLGRDDDVVVVVLVHPGVEDAGDLEGALGRLRKSGNRVDRLRHCDDLQSATRHDVQPLGQLGTEHGAARLSVECREREIARRRRLADTYASGTPAPAGGKPSTNAVSKYFRFTACTTACTCARGLLTTTPCCRLTRDRTSSHVFITMSSPYVRTRMSGLPVRIFSRRSFCRPFMTPMMTTSALTATVTPRIAISRDQRQQLRSRGDSANSAARDRQLEPTHHDRAPADASHLRSECPRGESHSGRSVGKRMTSRMLGVFVRYMNSRSIPMPTPPIGGMPYSIARK